MFGKLELPKFKVEVLLRDYFMRGVIQPRGDLVVFMNDARWNIFHFEDVELFPLAADRKMPGVKQPSFNVRKNQIVCVNVLADEDMEKIQLLATSRGIMIYTHRFVFQGNIHVNADSSDDDLFDDKWVFYPLSDAALFPVRQTPTHPQKKVKLCVINQNMLQGYHVK